MFTNPDRKATLIDIQPSLLPIERMSHLPPILSKGPYYIRNLAWDDRYVDLADAEIDGPIIGYGGNEGTNQQASSFPTSMEILIVTLFRSGSSSDSAPMYTISVPNRTWTFSS